MIPLGSLGIAFIMLGLIESGGLLWNASIGRNADLMAKVE
jgi:hypothetical protein